MARLMNEEELIEFYATNLKLAEVHRASDEHLKACEVEALNMHIERDLYRFNIHVEYEIDA